jgi:hypothetical protein
MTSEQIRQFAASVNIPQPGPNASDILKTQWLNLQLGIETACALADLNEKLTTKGTK